MLRPLLLNPVRKYQPTREEEVIFPELAKQVSLRLDEERRMRSSLLAALCSPCAYLEQQGDHQLAIALPNPAIRQDFTRRQ